MARAISSLVAIRYAAAILAGALLGGFLGLASAQDRSSGWLDTDCVGRCTANGYEAGFCDQVCWVPDPERSARADNLDWKCFQACRERGARGEYCLASCPRR